MITQYEIDMTRSTNRFMTSSREKAFALAQQMQEGEKNPTRHWLVGRRIRDRIAIEIDSHDEKNLRKVVGFYTRLFENEFVIGKTLHGYHLLQKKPQKDIELARAKVLCPGLTVEGLFAYRSTVADFFDELKENRKQKEYTLSELSEQSKKIPQLAVEYGIAYPIGEIDILHALVGVFRERYVLRISKKTPGDKMEVVKI